MPYNVEFCQTQHAAVPLNDRLAVALGGNRAHARICSYAPIPSIPALKERVGNLANAPRSYDFYEALAALRNLDELKTALPSDRRSPEAITRQLADVVWHYTYMHYFWLTEQRSNKQD
jgi:hypothetical protein